MLLSKLESCRCNLLHWCCNQGMRKQLVWLKKETERIASLQACATVDSVPKLKHWQGAIDAMLEREDLK